ncbi:MAG: hypothetical protein KO202_01305 [Methanobacteriaceae archaeon]|jgi:hypothetical protein|nr:hypothetical protein [Methanobacteriaceae archaeon]
MGLFSKKKSPEEEEKDKNIKKILGGFTWTKEVSILFKKYNKGASPEQAAWNQTKKEAKEGKIEPSQYLSRLEQLLGETPTQEKEKLLFYDEMPNHILKQKINEDQLNMVRQEAGTGWANLANTLSFNSYQQLVSWTQKAIIDQNKSLIRQIEFQQRTLDAQQKTLNEILIVLNEIKDKKQ